MNLQTKGTVITIPLFEAERTKLDKHHLIKQEQLKMDNFQRLLILTQSIQTTPAE